MILILGAALIALGVLSRLFALQVYRALTETDTRAVEPSFVPGTPWLHVASDRSALKLIVSLTYGSVLLGMILMLIGAL